jgi:uncharacterized membrane protein
MSATPPSGRGWNVALIVSLCVNLVLAGIIATALVRFSFFWHHPPAPPAPPPAQERVSVRQILIPRILIRVVPAKADAIRDLANSHKGRVDALRAESAVARRDVLRLYGEPAFDKPAFEQALVRMRAADAALETEVLKLAVETGNMLSPEERKAVAEWQPPHGRGFGDGRGWQHRGGPGGPPGDGPAR